MFPSIIYLKPTRNSIHYNLKLFSHICGTKDSRLAKQIMLEMMNRINDKEDESEIQKIT